VQFLDAYRHCYAQGETDDRTGQMTFRLMLQDGSGHVPARIPRLTWLMGNSFEPNLGGFPSVVDNNPYCKPLPTPLQTVWNIWRRNARVKQRQSRQSLEN
jgi:hypothetical protein